VSPEIGAKIYSFVSYGGKILKGEEGAEVLLKNQIRGIERAVKAGIIVKVNTVMIPTVNDVDIFNVSQKANVFENQMREE
jgi:nitrogen fixation protein NifB